MQKDTFLSLVRTFLTLMGSFIIGNVLWGHPLTSDTWDIIAGAALTISSTVWGIADKSVTVEQIQSAARSVLISIGGLLVAAGYITGKMLDALLGFIAPLITVIQSYTSKKKVVQIHSGDLKTTSTGKVVKILIFILISSTMFAKGQVTKPVPKPLVDPGTPAHVIFSKTEVLAVDSFQNAFRPIVGVAAFSEPGNQLMTGAGLGYQHLKWDYDAGKWQAQWSANLLFWAAGSVQPGPQIPAFAVGPTLGFFNNLLLIGGAYDFTHGQLIGTLSLGISLNN